MAPTFSYFEFSVKSFIAKIKNYWSLWNVNCRGFQLQFIFQNTKKKNFLMLNLFLEVNNRLSWSLLMVRRIHLTQNNFFAWKSEKSVRVTPRVSWTLKSTFSHAEKVWNIFVKKMSFFQKPVWNFITTEEYIIREIKSGSNFYKWIHLRTTKVNNFHFNFYSIKTSQKVPNH